MCSKFLKYIAIFQIYIDLFLQTILVKMTWNFAKSFFRILQISDVPMNSDIIWFEFGSDWLTFDTVVHKTH